MLGTFSDIAIETPTSLRAALKMLADARPAGSLKPLAGGTEVLVQLNAGVLRDRHFVNVLGIPQLTAIKVTPARVRIGAAVPYTAIMRHKTIRARFPILVEASRWIGAVQIQNRGTLGGNIVNASPAADAVPPLMAYDAELVLASVRGERRVLLADFYTGYKQFDLAPDELVVAVELPTPPPRVRHYFRKVGTRLAQSIAKVVLAGVLRTGKEGRVDHVRVVIGSVAPHTLRLRSVEESLLGGKLTPHVCDRAAELLVTRIAPIDDIRSTHDYRTFAAVACFRQFLEEGTHTALADLQFD